MSAIKLATVLAVLASCGDTAPAPVDATPPPQSLSGVFPAKAFLGQDLRVEISGDATHWDTDNAVAVEFGAGVTVHDISIASATSLFAEVTITQAATTGLTDVTVVGDTSLALTAAFDIEPPLEPRVAGTLAQGSVINVALVDHDVEHPFDVTFDAGSQTFLNIAIVPPAGVAVQAITKVTPFEVDAVLTIDVDAAPGELVVANGEPGHAAMVSAGTLAIQPRTAIPIANTTVDGGPLEAFASDLYLVTPLAPPTVTRVGVDGGSFVVLPASGHFADIVASGFQFEQFDPAAPAASATYYLVYSTPFPETAYRLEISNLALASSDETSASNETAASAQPLQAPAMLNAATLSSDHDVDFITVPVTAGDAGKVVHVFRAGDAGPVAEVFADAAGAISLGVSDDFTADLVSNPIPDGTTAIFVKFSASSSFDPDFPAYVAAIFLAN